MPVLLKIESDILRDIHLRMDGWKIRRFQAIEIHNNMTEKQLKLFSEINASKKVVIHNIGELNNFLVKFLS